MAILGSVIQFLILICLPCAFAVWVSYRVRWPVVAFFLAWLLTGMLSYIFVLLMAPFSPPGNDGTWALMIPIYNVGIGLFAGIAAGIISDRRRKKG